MKSAEVFAQLVHCGADTYLLSREATNPKWMYGQEWTTHLRRWNRTANKLSAPRSIQTSMSHNLAALCVSNASMVLVGGQYKSCPGVVQRPMFSGLKIAHVDSWASLSPVTATAAIWADGCVERRPNYPAGECEFDGRMSVHRTPDGRTHVFARANLRRGARWVQSTSSTDTRSWSPWSLATMTGVNPNTSSLYFLHVERWNSTHAIGLFPAVFERDTHGQNFSSAGVYATFSSNSDLRHWSRPLLLLRDESPSVGRVQRHPITVLDGRLLTLDRTAEPFEKGLMISIGRVVDIAPQSAPPEGSVAAFACWPERWCGSESESV